jgi:molybdate transport system substrate-binding protein
VSPCIRLPRDVIACAALLLVVGSQASPVRAEHALVAVATNFAEAMGHLESGFEAQTGFDIAVVTGSTGKLYAQIINGAPFDAFLAADRERPRLLDENGAAVAGTRFTYAIGRLALWSPDPGRIVGDGAAVLREGDFRRLAMANPVLAPYGLAARETLEALGLRSQLEDRIVLGENIGQAHAMVATGNAELGFVALSYVLSPRNDTPGSRWDVPQSLYSPIRQDAVLLRRGAGNLAATAFIEWLRGAGPRDVIERFGYAVE